jgi:hypothetical protein
VFTVKENFLVFAVIELVLFGVLLSLRADVSGIFLS